MNRLRIVLIAALVLAMPTIAHGQRRGEIKPGSPAPGLDIETWVSNKPASIENGKVFVVCFLDADRMGETPLFVVMGELLSLYEGQDLSFVAIAASDPTQVVPDKLMKNEHMFAGSDRRSSSSRAWVQAANQTELPVAFIVDRKSVIQYIGSPTDQKFKDVLAQVMDDRYDANLLKQAEPYIQPAANARKVRNFRQCYMHLDKIIALNKRVFAKYMLMKFEIMLLDEKDPDGAYAYAEQLIGDNSDDPTFLSWLATFIVTDPRIKDEDRDLDVAMKAAKVSFDNARPDDPGRFALLALVYYHQGQLLEAVDNQEQAWLVARPNDKDQYWRTLIAYKDAARRQGVLTSRR